MHCRRSVGYNALDLDPPLGPGHHLRRLASRLALPVAQTIAALSPSARRVPLSRLRRVRRHAGFMVRLAEGGMRAMSDESEFERELAIFQVEHETAQQYFFSYASLQGIEASNSDVLRSMNATPLFWLTVKSAMLLSTFIALGRIFGRSGYNLDRLMAAP
jgi:hypothetical protein